MCGKFILMDSLICADLATTTTRHLNTKPVRLLENRKLRSRTYNKLKISSCNIFSDKQYILKKSFLRSAIQQTNKRLRIVTNAAAFNMNEESEFEEEMCVPRDQRPVNELRELQQASLYSWGELPTPLYARNLGLLWLGFFTLLGAPIAGQTYPMDTQFLQFFLAGGCGGFVPVVLATLRIYLGWEYVGNRLLSAVVEYEETGWYDGQIWVKSPEVLARDRLLGSYKVKPTLARLKNTMLISALILVFSSLVLGGVLTFEPEEAKSERAPVPIATSEGLVYSSTLKSAASRGQSALFSSDEDAEQEALALKGVPGYCGDRYSKAVAGGQYCDKFTK